jgi:hypothetical protein
MRLEIRYEQLPRGSFNTPRRVPSGHPLKRARDAGQVSDEDAYTIAIVVPIGEKDGIAIVGLAAVAKRLGEVIDGVFRKRPVSNSARRLTSKIVYVKLAEITVTHDPVLHPLSFVAARTGEIRDRCSPRFNLVRGQCVLRERVSISV